MKVATPTPPRTAGTPSSPAPGEPGDRVVIVGAGPAGMATAIELAQHGVPSVVLEKRGLHATRDPLFAVVPPFADRLAALDPEGSLTRLLTPIERIDSTHVHVVRSSERAFQGPLAPDATRSRGDIGAVIRAAQAPGRPGSDQRRWALAGIDAVDNGLRALAREKYPDLIDLRPDTPVESIRQGDGWAEAVLARGAAGGGAGDAVRGAMLVDASGRDLLGGRRTTYPERAFWIGARFAAPEVSEGTEGHVVKRVRDAEPSQPALTTVALPSDDRTIVWAQVPQDPASMSPQTARNLVAERAAVVGVDASSFPLDARTMPVTVQLWTKQEPAQGRVLQVGDSVRGPYFMTSTGAATALVHDAPRAVDAILAVRSGMAPERASAAYADAVRGANAKLIELVRPRLRGDLDLPPLGARG